VQPLSSFRWWRIIGQAESLYIGAWKFVCFFDERSKTTLRPGFTLCELLPCFEIFLRQEEGRGLGIKNPQNMGE
jgi:hypothetical protein